jgi:hypothetical protein
MRECVRVTGTERMIAWCVTVCMNVRACMCVGVLCVYPLHLVFILMQVNYQWLVAAQVCVRGVCLPAKL